MLTRTDRRFHEGNASPGKTTYTTHEYDPLGNVTRFTDAGDTGAADDVVAVIAYTACPNYLVKPTRIDVTGGGAALRRREATLDCATGNVTEVRQVLANGSAATTNLAYLPNGNLQSVTGPANHAGQRYTLTYEYDPVVATHVARVTDSFGLSSQASHDYRFGKVITTTDTNAHQTTYFHDPVGRVVSITGPYEQGQATATLAFAYAPVETPASDATGQTVPLTQVPWALTRHVDKDAGGALKPSGTLDTLLFTDGLKRVVQTKKDASVLEAGASQPADKMIVSGQVTFDPFGRAIVQRYPVTEPKGGNTAFNASADPEPPTVTDHDVLDRVTRTVIPDGSTTTIAYGFGPDRGGATQFQTVVTDANVNAGKPGAVKTSYRDVRDLIVAVKERLAGADLWTSYTYDALKQIVEVRDHQDNLTKVTYDHLGRRTAIANPDTGLTEYAYDLASNLVSKVSPTSGPRTRP